MIEFTDIDGVEHARYCCNYCSAKSQWQPEGRGYEGMGGWMVGYVVYQRRFDLCPTCLKSLTRNEFTPDADKVLRAVAQTLPEQPANVEEF